MADRSPLVLRSRKLSQTSNIAKAKEQKKTEPNPRRTTVGLSLTNLKPSDVSKKFLEIESNVQNYRQELDKSIQAIRDEFDIKCAKMLSIIVSQKSEIDILKACHCSQQSNAIQPYWRNKLSYEYLNFILQGTCINQIENQYKHQINELEDKINAIEIYNKQTTIQMCAVDAESKCDLSVKEYELFDDNFAVSNPIKSIVYTNSDKNNFMIAIETLQEQMSHIDNMLQTDEEMFKKMNGQMHILSSKFIDFNAKICNFLYDYNQKNNNQINIKDFIDDDTLSFMEKDIRDNVNTFAFHNKATNRFMSKFNMFGYSNNIKVRLDFTTVYNLDKLIPELKKKFERCIGKGSIKNISIKHFRANENVINRIDVIITFRMPLSYSYLNEIKFPTNWIFFDPTVKRHQTKHPVNRRCVS